MIRKVLSVVAIMVLIGCSQVPPTVSEQDGDLDAAGHEQFVGRYVADSVQVVPVSPVVPEYVVMTLFRVSGSQDISRGTFTLGTDEWDIVGGQVSTFFAATLDDGQVLAGRWSEEEIRLDGPFFRPNRQIFLVRSDGDE